MTPCRCAAVPLSEGDLCKSRFSLMWRRSMTADNLAISTYWAVIDRPYSRRHRLSKGIALKGQQNSPPCKGGKPPAKREPDRAKLREKAAGSHSRMAFASASAVSKQSAGRVLFPDLRAFLKFVSVPRALL